MPERAPKLPRHLQIALLIAGFAAPIPEHAHEIAPYGRIDRFSAATRFRSARAAQFPAAGAQLQQSLRPAMPPDVLRRPRSHPVSARQAAMPDQVRLALLNFSRASALFPA
jgi:hypothetical protein